MQAGSSREEDQNDTISFSIGVASIPRLHQHLDHHHHHLPQTHLYQPTFSSQQHHLHHYPSLTSIMSTRDHDNNISPSSHLSSNTSFLETLPQSDLDRILSKTMNVNTHSQYHHQQQQQQQQQQTMFYSSTSSLAPSSSAMNPNNQPQATKDHQPAGKENGSSSGRVVKKRTRASRKTHTTVLTTDTTNFRAMVQEFTGISTPPFCPSSLFPSKKFDVIRTNNVLDHPSLGTLQFSLNNSTSHSNPNPFPPHINPFATERNQSSHSNLYQQPSQQMMLPQVSNSTFINLPHVTDHIKNTNLAFSISQRPPFSSRYSNSRNVVEHGENDNISMTG